MQTKFSLESAIIRWSRIIALIGLVGLLVLAGITVGEVLLRWLFKYPIIGVYDVSQLVVVIVVSSCFPLVSAERRHISVNFLGTMAGGRTKDFLEAFGAFLTMIIFLLMTWQLWIYTNELSASHQTTWLLHWPSAPWWRAATVLFALCFPIQLMVFWVSLRSAIKRNHGGDNKC